MDQIEFEKIKATFPWTERILHPPIGPGGLVQVIDRNGFEVPIFTMTRFLEMITQKLVAKPETEASGEQAV